MIGRDRIVLRWKNRDGDPIEKIVHGIVVTEDIDTRIEPGEYLYGRAKYRAFFRVLLPRTLDVPDTRDIYLSFRDRTGVRPETPIAPIHDARGRVHHYEAIVRAGYEPGDQQG